jgi:hypothetical protein
MVKRYTFHDLVLIYMRLEDSHRLIVDGDADESTPIPDLTLHAGPLASLDTVLSYQKDGRYFCRSGFDGGLALCVRAYPSERDHVRNDRTDER